MIVRQQSDIGCKGRCRDTALLLSVSRATRAASAAAAIYGLDPFEERHWWRAEEALARTVSGMSSPASTRASDRPPDPRVVGTWPADMATLAALVAHLER